MPKIVNFPAEIKDWLVSEQPYSGTHGKSILPTIIVSSNSIHLEMVRGRGFKHGDKVATASVPINQKMSFNPDFAFDLIFSQKGPAKGAVVRTWLMEAHRYILQDVVPKFKPFLP
jgi:hypothetical protein